MCMTCAVPAIAAILYVVGIMKWVVLKTTMFTYYYTGKAVVWIFYDLCYGLFVRDLFLGSLTYISVNTVGIDMVWFYGQAFEYLLFESPIVSGIVSLVRTSVELVALLIYLTALQVAKAILYIVIALARVLRFFLWVGTLGLIDVYVPQAQFDSAMSPS